MTNRGPQSFFYSRELPPRAVAIAEVKARASTPASLVDIDNMFLATDRGPGALTATPYPIGGTPFTAPDLMIPVQVSGSGSYILLNQFFEITPVALNGVPLFYRHEFMSPLVEDVAIMDLDGVPVTVSLLRDNVLYHGTDGRPCKVNYSIDGIPQSELLQYEPAMARAVNNASPNSYVLTPGGVLTVYTANPYWIRFVQQNGYSLMPVYGAQPNEPWYPRIRFSLRPVAKEWGQQLFSPSQGYLLATWVPGKVCATNLVELERQPAYFDGVTYPDLLIYDKDFGLKYALDGSAPNSRADKGTLFPWIRNQFLSFEKAHSRCLLSVELEPSDQVFGFYYYAERDLLFKGLDINPFTNPRLRDKVIEFYYADRSDTIPE